jgi:uncharacterized damage-inducible protein DinB
MSSLATTVQPLFERDLSKWIAELQQYPTDASVWALSPAATSADGIKNSAGTLSLHILGNLNHFIGAILGNTGYIRDRDAEFSSRDVPRDVLVAQLQATSTMLAQVLPTLTAADLAATFPKEALGYPMTTEYFLVHLYGHLNWHLGQMNYHRRLLAVPQATD